MSTASPAFYKALNLYLADKMDYEADRIEVVSFYDYQEETGYCDTCTYMEYFVDITWKDLGDTDSRWQVYKYEGSFSDLLDDILNIELGD